MHMVGGRAKPIDGYQCGGRSILRVAAVSTVAADQQERNCDQYEGRSYIFLHIFHPYSKLCLNILPYPTFNSTLKWRLYIINCIGQGIIWCANLNADLPVSGHRQVTARTEMPLAIGEQVEALGSHVHIEHSGVDRNANVRVRLACAVINHRYGEHVGAETIRVDRKGCAELAVICAQGSCIDLCFPGGLLLRRCCDWRKRTREDIHQTHAYQYGDAQHRFPAQDSGEPAGLAAKPFFAQTHLLYKLLCRLLSFTRGGVFSAGSAC